MNARKLIIDCDPGIDDSLALMLAAASKELDLVGITTVSGNVPASMGAKNALKILSMIGKADHYRRINFGCSERAGLGELGPKEYRNSQNRAAGLCQYR